MTLTIKKENIALRSDLRTAVEDRAKAIMAIYHELAEVTGKAEAEALIEKALYKNGQKAGKAYVAVHGGKKPTPEQIVSEYARSGPDCGRLFPLEYVVADDGTCEVTTLECPLKSMMERAGASSEEFHVLAKLLDSGTAGLFDGVGLRIETFLPKLSDQHCCRLHISSK